MLVSETSGLDTTPFSIHTQFMPANTYYKIQPNGYLLSRLSTLSGTELRETKVQGEPMVDIDEKQATDVCHILHATLSVYSDKYTPTPHTNSNSNGNNNAIDLTLQGAKFVDAHEAAQKAHKKQRQISKPLQQQQHQHQDLTQQQEQQQPLTQPNVAAKVKFFEALGEKEHEISSAPQQQHAKHTAVSGELMRRSMKMPYVCHVHLRWFLFTENSLFSPCM